MKKPDRIVRIFLAEDNATDVMLVEEALKRRNITCQLAVYPNARAAITAAELCGVNSPIPDLILLDLNLPSGQGCDVLLAAASNPQLASVPKAILSSFMGPAEVHRAQELGASGFIMKPVDREDFVVNVGAQIVDLLH